MSSLINSDRSHTKQRRWNELVYTDLQQQCVGAAGLYATLAGWKFQLKVE
jgi:hypothetical protein